MTIADIISQGIGFHTARQYEQARLCYDCVLRLDPTNTEVWFRLGDLLLCTGHADEALAAFHQSLSLAPSLWQAWAHQGVALRQLCRLPEAIKSYRQALELNPADAETHNNLGVALQFTNEHALAIESYHRAWQLRPDYHAARLREGMEHLLLGDFAAGLPLYEARIQAITGHRSCALGPGGWDGTQPLQGKRLLLYAEQGLGDTLQFARYAPLLPEQGASVILEVQAPLHGLLAATLPSTITVIPAGAALPAYDLHCALPSLPWAFGTRLASIPGIPLKLGLSTPAAASTHSESPRVGFVWAGNPSHTNDLNRSIPLETLLPLLQLPGIVPVLLQKDLRPGDLALLGSLGLENPAAGFKDFKDTVAAMQTLDCIVTVDTALAHLAGCLGLPTALLLSTVPDWRWLLGRQDSPWYPTLRLFRQEHPGDWAPVLSRVAQHLRQTLHLPEPGLTLQHRS